jgi:2-polyprenyl-3-methyl-5-hydroxy-6-metoxy-1,4-benzoquinol methylase
VSFRGWLYSEIGEYHRNLNPSWSYTPTYLRKMVWVRRFLQSLPHDAAVLDAGCGEGVLVEEYRQKGWNIQGLDLNYESEAVRLGDVRHMPYADACWDVVLFLDTLEHLTFEDQPTALSEIYRVLKPGGSLVMSVPNLAHLNSRVRFFMRGHLDRTDIETNHVGERPMWEYEQLLRTGGFHILKRVGVTLTLPWVYRGAICKHPARFRWVHDALEPLARLLPSLAMVTIFVCQIPALA